MDSLTFLFFSAVHYTLAYTHLRNGRNLKVGGKTKCPPKPPKEGKGCNEYIQWSIDWLCQKMLILYVQLLLSSHNWLARTVYKRFHSFWRWRFWLHRRHVGRMGGWFCVVWRWGGRILPIIRAVDARQFFMFSQSCQQTTILVQSMGFAVILAYIFLLWRNGRTSLHSISTKSNMEIVLQCQRTEKALAVHLRLQNVPPSTKSRTDHENHEPSKQDMGLLREANKRQHQDCIQLRQKEIGWLRHLQD